MDRNRGFSLVEVVIAIAIMGIVLLTIWTVVDTSNETYANGTMLQDLQEKSRVILGQISGELRQASSGVNPNPLPVIATGPSGDQTITFARPLGAFRYDSDPTSITYRSLIVDPDLDTYDTATGQPVWSEPITYGSDPAVDDPDDGIDNNGNGLVDERRVYRIGPPSLNPVNTVLYPPPETWHKDYLGDYLKEGTLRFTPTVLGGVLNRVRIELTFERRDTKWKPMDPNPLNDRTRLLTVPASVLVTTRN